MGVRDNKGDRSCGQLSVEQLYSMGKICVPCTAFHKPYDPYTDYAIVNIETGEVLVDRVHDRTYTVDDVDDYGDGNSEKFE